MNSAAHTLATLKSVFGYDAFRGEQEEVVSHLVNGGDALVIMPTGAGKSMCYQLPSLIRAGTGIVVSPLIALMRDQVEALKEAGVRAAVLNSSLTTAQAFAVKKSARAGQLDLLYVAPERVVTEEFQQLLSEIPIALFAIDEVHCVSQWGHDFRPEYLQLEVLHQKFPDVPRIAVTATADEATRAEIIQKLSLQDARVFLGGFDRPNIQYHVTLKNNPRAQLLAFLKSQPKDHSGIVYCLSRKKVEETAAYLAGEGYRAISYHAGLESNVREKNQDRFLKEEGIIVVATIAFGMGVDKPDVRFVCHLDLPKSIEAYYQETGRAGRDGEPSIAWMLYGMGDLVSMKQMIDRSDGGEMHKRLAHRKLNELLGFCETIRCRREVLLRYFGDTGVVTCGNCDTCLAPVDTWEGTRVAQMALSTVYRTEQRFGAQYLINILRGSAEDERVSRFRHDKLSVFGIGKELSNQEWHSVFRQLLAAGYLQADQEYGSLLLSGASRAVLKGELAVNFRRDPAPRKEAKPRSERRVVVDATELQGEVDEPLFDALRVRRREIAQKQGLPPYVIFHDKTLREMAILKPRTLDAMTSVSGIGESKRNKYGAVFLEVIERHAAG